MIKISKMLKTTLIVFFSVILFIFLVLITAPLLFKNQLMDLAKTELNKMLLAKVDFKDLQLSFIRNFPNAYIALDGLEVVGVGDFEDELLVAFDSFNVTVDIMSVIKMENIEVKSILLDTPRLNGHILEDGRANWEIMKPAEGEAEEEEPLDEEETEAEVVEAEEEAEPGADPFKFKVGLNKFEIRNLSAAFHDEKNKMTAEVGALNFNLRGDMKRENVDLNLSLAIDDIDFWMDGVRLANKVTVGFVSKIAADLKNMDFVIKDNKFNLNDIVLIFQGSVGLHGDDINADVTFATERTDFKSLLSLVPAIYMNDFKDLKTTGSLDLSGEIKGTYNKEQMPNADVKLAVNDATFSYPDLPKSVQKINIAVRAHYDGEVFDRTTADVDRFSFEIAGNPFLAEVHVKTPESDMQVSAKFSGRVDIDSISDIIPLADMTLSGLLECNLSVAGRMSTLQNERYEDFQAAGHLRLSRFNFVSPALPRPVSISSTELNFTPRYVELANFNARIGNTDVALNGSLENFIPFVLKNETIKGSLSLRSNNIDLNEFMGGEKKEDKKTSAAASAPAEEKSPMSVIEVPQNIDFALNINIGKLLFDKLSITNTVGAVTVKDGKLVMRNLAMNLLEGSMVLSGEYNTQNKTVPIVDFNMNINRFDVSSAISSFAFIQNILPEPQNYAGKVSAALTLNSVLDQQMSPVLDSINSKGRLQTHTLQIRNSKIFGAVAAFSRNETLRTPTLDNLNIGFEIKNGRVFIEDPIVMNIPPARIEIKGDQGLDSSLNYKLDVFMPMSTIGSGATDILSRIPGGSNIKEVQLTGAIKGTAKNPEVSLSVADMVSSVRDQVIDTVRTQVSAEINRQIDQIMAEANRQAENIRSAAKQAADRVRREANTAAQRGIDEAGRMSNPVARAAAVKLAQDAAPGIRRKGEEEAQKLEREADVQARNVLTAAQRKADELRRK